MVEKICFEQCQEPLDDYAKRARICPCINIHKVSKFGSVEVEKLMNIEPYSHVMHISSTISSFCKFLLLESSLTVQAVGMLCVLHRPSELSVAPQSILFLEIASPLFFLSLSYIIVLDY
ncbi:unnamed protein product [Cuscuta campestris]|uniref:Uncharacterized protein n=1 Tax=Cuscuta campestris TaxID=132261 RepID=A0A484MEE0_9ASTE|nr:unnamed protein product [Cuscuta campestris]